MLPSTLFLESLLSLFTVPVPPCPVLEETNPYQIQFKKNYQLIRNKYKPGVLPAISFAEVSRVSLYLNTNMRSF
jgi:hypothetical protein